MMRRLALVILVLAQAATARAEVVTVAVASNFIDTAEAIAAAFEADTGHDVRMVHGSSGGLAAQAAAGAPFDVFLSADAERPAALAATGKALRTRTYAIGKLVLVSREPIDRDDPAPGFEGRTVALADPLVAPYGDAARAVMEAMDLDTSRFRPVVATNVGQAASLFATGNADIAFLAASQLPLLDTPHVISLDGMHPPIRQDAALLDDGNPAARAFWAWLFGAQARGLIERAGYEVPE